MDNLHHYRRRAISFSHPWSQALKEQAEMYDFKNRLFDLTELAHANCRQEWAMYSPILEIMHSHGGTTDNYRLLSTHPQAGLLWHSHTTEATEPMSAKRPDFIAFQPNPFGFVYLWEAKPLRSRVWDDASLFEFDETFSASYEQVTTYARGIFALNPKVKNIHVILSVGPYFSLLIFKRKDFEHREAASAETLHAAENDIPQIYKGSEEMYLQNLRDLEHKLTTRLRKYLIPDVVIYKQPMFENYQSGDKWKSDMALSLPLRKALRTATRDSQARFQPHPAFNCQGEELDLSLTSVVGTNKLKEARGELLQGVIDDINALRGTLDGHESVETAPGVEAENDASYHPPSEATSDGSSSSLSRQSYEAPESPTESVHNANSNLLVGPGPRKRGRSVSSDDVSIDLPFNELSLSDPENGGGPSTSTPIKRRLRNLPKRAQGNTVEKLNFGEEIIGKGKGKAIAVDIEQKSPPPKRTRHHKDSSDNEQEEEGRQQDGDEDDEAEGEDDSEDDDEDDSDDDDSDDSDYEEQGEDESDD
ncbi:hypothetical protein C8Q75DRAFT_869232 [Abortiporus biennis]|nr:hypothetical protein C8Q75DRAFT_869232 [Abortiporus biennis]